MSVAQGINKQTSFKKQSGLGVTASGAGGQRIRRETLTLEVTKDTYSSDEVVSHQQHTGDIHGVRRSQGTLNGLLSGGTYQSFYESLLRKAAAATAAITGMSITIATSGSNWTLTRAAGDFLAGGVKIGDVGQLTAGSFNAANLNKSLLVINATATVLTVTPVNGVGLVAEGPITSATWTTPGKKIIVPTTGHTNDYYTLEEWYSDLSINHLYPDIQIGQAQVAIPATGLVSSNFNLVGLGARTKGVAQTLTSPTAETTTSVVSSVAGAVLLNGARYATITSGNLTIDGNVSQGEAVVGSNSIPDVQRGRIKVSGTFTALFDGDTPGSPFETESAVNLVFVCATDQTANAPFVVFSMSAVKVFSNTPDDGEKQIIRTYNFTAQIQASGGAALANDQTIISIQDSLYV